MTGRPTNDGDDPICGRRCADGSRCLNTVALPGTACYLHRGAEQEGERPTGWPAGLDDTS